MSVALGFVEWATLCLQELTHGPFDLRGATAVMQERPLQELVRPFVGCWKSINATRQAISHRCAHHSRVLEEDRLRDTVAPTRLRLADGLTQDKGEAVECLRRSLRSGSYVLRGEE